MAITAAVVAMLTMVVMVLAMTIGIRRAAATVSMVRGSCGHGCGQQNQCADNKQNSSHREAPLGLG
jgi:hypothetical protein